MLTIIKSNYQTLLLELNNGRYTYIYGIIKKET